MSRIAMTSFLHRVLLADALTSAAAGAVMVLGAATPLPARLGLPPALLLAAGTMLLPWSLMLLWLAKRPVVPVAAIGVVIACNLLWAVDCAWIVLGRAYAPTPLGQAFVAAQALAVAVLAELEWIGLRRAPSATLAA